MHYTKQEYRDALDALEMAVGELDLRQNVDLWDHIGGHKHPFSEKIKVNLSISVAAMRRLYEAYKTAFNSRTMRVAALSGDRSLFGAGGAGLFGSFTACHVSSPVFGVLLVGLPVQGGSSAGPCAARQHLHAHPALSAPSLQPNLPGDGKLKGIPAT